MKAKISRWFAAISFVFMLLLLSCQEEFNEMFNIEDQKLINESKEWYNENHLPVMTLGTGTKNVKPLLLKPFWENAFTSENNGIDIVEVPVKSKGRFGFLSEDLLNVMNRSNNYKWSHSLTRLIIKKTANNYEAFLMTMIGEPEYLEKSNFFLHRNTYSKIDKDFDGAILYHSSNGQFLNGDFLMDGKIIGHISLKDDNNNNLRTESNCITIEYTTSMKYQNCVEWTVVTEFNGQIMSTYTETDCYGSYSVETTYSVLICGENVDYYSQTDGTGSASTHGEDPWPQGKCDNDPLWEMKLSDHLDPNKVIPGCERVYQNYVCDNKQNIRWHGGYDIAAEIGTPVFSITSGVVQDVRSDSESTGYGNMIVIRYNNISIVYAHLDRKPNFNIGDTVSMGNQLGWSGESDTVGNPHLHIEAKVTNGGCFYKDCNSTISKYDVASLMGTTFDTNYNPVRVNNCY